MERKASEPEPPDCCSSRHPQWTVSAAKQGALPTAGAAK